MSLPAAETHIKALELILLEVTFVPLLLARDP
jgi:hypothetical protein